jgi:hypothetical protein
LTHFGPSFAPDVCDNQTKAEPDDEEVRKFQKRRETKKVNFFKSQWMVEDDDDDNDVYRGQLIEGGN